MFLSRKLDVLCLSGILDNNTSLVPIILLKKLLVNLNYLKPTYLIYADWLVRSWFEPGWYITLIMVNIFDAKINKNVKKLCSGWILIGGGKVNHAQIMIPRGSWKCLGCDIWRIYHSCIVSTGVGYMLACHIM